MSRFFGIMVGRRRSFSVAVPDSSRMLVHDVLGAFVALFVFSWEEAKKSLVNQPSLCFLWSTTPAIRDSDVEVTKPSLPDNNGVRFPSMAVIHPDAD